MVERVLSGGKLDDTQYPIVKRGAVIGCYIFLENSAKVVCHIKVALFRLGGREGLASICLPFLDYTTTVK
jgi:hypothetical protein